MYLLYNLFLLTLQHDSLCEPYYQLASSGCVRLDCGELCHCDTLRKPQSHTVVNVGHSPHFSAFCGHCFLSFLWSKSQDDADVTAAPKKNTLLRAASEN